jgi:hypothetical protein
LRMFGEVAAEIVTGVTRRRDRCWFRRPALAGPFQLQFRLSDKYPGISAPV